MKLWFARDSEIPIREQLVTQVILAILCDDLEAGERLPSTRELARRFHLHPNTVSAAYRELQKDKWVEFKHGSGVYVRKTKPETTLSAQAALDQQIAGLFRSARGLGIPLQAVHARLRQWLAAQPPDHFLVIEPDENLRNVVLTELQDALRLKVRGAGFESCKSVEELSGAIVLALPSKADVVREALPAGMECVTLHVRSVPESLGEWLPARADRLVAVASGWPGFLASAKTMLVAAGFSADALVIRDTREAGWQQGLKPTVAVICDAVTAKSVEHKRVICFPLLAQSTLDELRRYEELISSPIQ